MSEFEFIVASKYYSKITDGTHDSPKQMEMGKPLITSKHIKGRNIDFESAYLISEEDFEKINARSQVEKWDVIISMIGEYCGYSYIERNDNIDYAVKNVGLFKTSNKLEAEWLYYYLNSPVGVQYLRKARSGSSQPYLTLNGLRDLPILHPKDQSHKEQIAKVLSDLDAKIDLNNKINVELEAMAKLIYDYWFVQFEFPIEAAQAAKMGFPELTGKPYKSSGGKMVWNEELKREIPEGWESGTIGSYCPSTGGFAFKSSWWSDEGVSVIKIKDIREDYTIDPSDLSKVDLTDKKVEDKFKAIPGNVLIAMTGATVGKYAIVPYSDNPIYVNQRVGYFNLGNEPFDRLPFLINSLNQKYFREVIFVLASGAAQPNISNEQINNIQLVVPIETTIETYNTKMSSIYKRILNNQHENQKLAELRDWLLPMLMNGQVKVN